MKKIAAILIFTSLSFCSAYADDDKRELVKFPEMMKNHMLGNMRDHLKAITEIHQYLAEEAFDKASNVAEQRLGLSSLDDHGAAHMAKMMPEGMRNIGTGMHKAASQFALNVEEKGLDGDYKTILSDLSKITQQCVACHSSYRVQ